MPKLQQAARERKQAQIETAALRLFTRQGFHGTSVRDIADAAGVSIGNIYNHYPTKEALFDRIATRYQQRMERIQRQKLVPLIGRTDARSLRLLARAVRDIVYRYPDYWHLMYVDVIEFGNRHFARIFRDLARNLERMAGGYDRKAVQALSRRKIHFSLAYPAIYLQFFTYYLVEKLFRGQQHLGMAEDLAIDQLIRIFTEGVGVGPARARVASGGNDESQNLDDLSLPRHPARRRHAAAGADPDHRPDHGDR